MKAMNRTIAVAVAVLAGGGTVGSALAHHSFAMFDRGTEIVMHGTVARWAFNSPHVAIYIENEAGELWAFEAAAPARVIPLGMTGYTFKPGDPIIVIGCPLHDGRQGGAVGFIVKAGDEANFDAWFRPNDGGCGPSQNWREWLPAGYRSRAEAEAAAPPQSQSQPQPQ